MFLVPTKLFKTQLNKIKATGKVLICVSFYLYFINWFCLIFTTLWSVSVLRFSCNRNLAYVSIFTSVLNPMLGILRCINIQFRWVLCICTYQSVNLKAITLCWLGASCSMNCYLVRISAFGVLDKYNSLFLLVFRGRCSFAKSCCWQLQ